MKRLFSSVGLSAKKDPTNDPLLQNNVKRRQLNKKAVEEQSWFYGLCPLEEVKSQVANSGDFIVSVEEVDESIRILLSFRHDANIITLTIHASAQKGFRLPMVHKKKYFPTIYELVKYYKDHPLKLKESYGQDVEAHLLFGVPRPDWLLNSKTIVFDSDQKALGSGNFARVFLGDYFPDIDNNDSRKIPVALKFAKGGQGEQAKNAKQDIIREGKAMSFFNHPNVIKVSQSYGVACDRLDVVLVMEYCPGGNLEKHLRTHQAAICNGERVSFCVEVAMGMRYLHGKGCIHRDLAARNCLISSDGVIKIADFGLCQFKEIRNLDRLQTAPVRWMAPETLVKQPKYSTKSDVWSFGMLVYEVFNNGETAWPMESAKRVVMIIRHEEMPKMPPYTPLPIQRLVTCTWSKDRWNRPTFFEILKLLCEMRQGPLKPPPVVKCSVNAIPNVHREASVTEEELSSEESMESNNEEFSTSSTLTSSEGSTRSSFDTDPEDPADYRKPPWELD